MESRTWTKRSVGSGFCNEFDNMNTGGDTHSSEANMEANPDGSKLYAVWAQWVFDATGEEVVESDCHGAADLVDR